MVQQERRPEAFRWADMETTLDADDDIAQAAHRLIIQYGSRAAEFARGHARIAEDADDERTWLEIAEAIDRD